MSELPIFSPGGYRWIPGPFQYSSGVAAMPGFIIRRVTFREPLPLVHGFDAAEYIIKAAGRPLTAFCACELRSPAPFTEQGFDDFNRDYVGTLSSWGIYDEATKTNPVARSNVCPPIAPPPEPSMYAFSFTDVAGYTSAPTFVIAGSGEARPGPGTYPDRIVRLGETSADAIAEKARFVLDVMEKRLAALGAGWRDTTAVQVYSIHDIHPLMASEIARRGAAPHGLTWHYCRPPVVGLEYEMDCRAVAIDLAFGG